MSHFAEIDENGIVKRVIVADQAFIDSGAVGDSKNWVETFKDASARKNFAGIGYQYDTGRDAFTAPKPFPSFVLDERTARWEAPKEMPKDGKLYGWNEQLQDWQEKIRQ